MQNQKPYYELIIFSILTGIVGIFVKLISDINIFEILFLRALIAMLFILIIILIKKETRQLKIKYPIRTIGTGLLLTMAISLYFISILKTTISNAIFLLYTAPLFSVILSKIFLKEKIEKKTIKNMLIIILGISLLIEPQNFSFKSEETLGNLLALLAGFFYASMGICSKPLSKKVPKYYIVFWEFFIMSIIFVAFFKINSIETIIDNITILLIIGIICTGIPFVMFADAIKKIKGQKIFSITSIEPLTGVIFATIILKEVPSIFTIIGSILILYGVYKISN